MYVTCRWYILIPYDAPLNKKKEKVSKTLRDLPIFFHIDRPIVVIFHGRILVRLITSRVKVRLIHG